MHALKSLITTHNREEPEGGGGGGGRGLTGLYSSDSFAAEVEQTKININILRPRNTFDLKEKAKRTGKRRTLQTSVKAGFSQS